MHGVFTLWYSRSVSGDIELLSLLQFASGHCSVRDSRSPLAALIFKCRICAQACGQRALASGRAFCLAPTFCSALRRLVASVRSPDAAHSGSPRHFVQHSCPKIITTVAWPKVSLANVNAHQPASCSNNRINRRLGVKNEAKRRPPPGIQAQRPRTRTARTTRQINGAILFGG